jgi:hypothetical protein
MKGIYIAAIVATALAIAIDGGVIWWKSGRAHRPLLLLAFLATIPMCALMFYAVRMPFNDWLVGVMGAKDPFYRFLTTFYAPLTEEPAKLWPLLIPWFRRRIVKENAVAIAMALGLGFGVGEMWFLAERISHDPTLSAYPWYQLTGFINERFMVCIMHGAFTATALVALRKGRFAFGFAGAAFLHYLGNFPIYLGALDVGHLGKPTWTIILGVWVALYFVAMLTLIIWYAAGRKQAGRAVFGRAKCPACGTVYDRPLFGFNLVTKRYEPCPACHKWHLTGEYKEPPAAKPAS